MQILELNTKPRIWNGLGPQKTAWLVKSNLICQCIPIPFRLLGLGRAQETASSVHGKAVWDTEVRTKQSKTLDYIGATIDLIVTSHGPSPAVMLGISKDR
jgi:hypothetical protein